MKIFGAPLLVVIGAAVNAGKAKEITTQILIIENIDDHADLLIVDEFKAENAENIKRKCPKKKKICLNCEKPNYTKGKSPCKDGSKPRCKCKCPKRMKICANGEMPFRNNRHCKDGSDPRCPIAATPSSTSEAPLNIVTPGAFSTGKPVETIKPRKDNLVQPPEVTLFTGERPGITSFTGSYQGPTSFTGQAPAPTTTGHSTTWHKDPFPTGVVHPSKGVGEVGGGKEGKQSHPAPFTGQRPGPTSFTGERPGPTSFTGERPGPTSFTGQRPGPTSFTGQRPFFTTTGYSTSWHQDPLPTGVVHPSKGVGEVGVGKQAHPTAAAKIGEEARIGIHGGGGDLLLNDTHLVGIQASHI